MRRWRKDVKRCHTRIEINYEGCSLTPEAQRCHKMQKAFDEIKELANDSDNKCMIVMTWMDNVKEKLSKHNVICGSDQPTPQSPIGRNIENDVSSIPNPSQRIRTPLAARKKGRPPFKRRKSQLEQAVKKKQDSKKKKQESNKKIKSCGNNTNGEKQLNDLQPIDFDDIGHIVGSSTSKGDGVVGTQESIAMQENMATFVGFTQNSQLNQLYRGYEIGHMDHPILHENHFLDHQYQYWNEDYNIYMPGFSSGGSGGQRN
ncbi:uncharacterized protein LOC110762434 [Prunus avium]|uniref:Uncharacterized protein LOC110762434 n=1 Tax=Prunus avium TaxID=42229 RepID=A0A6P5T2Q6_PRUAV|nr:uncharacterized protein LOC110762434 [Prunus avium]